MIQLGISFHIVLLSFYTLYVPSFISLSLKMQQLSLFKFYRLVLIIPFSPLYCAIKLSISLHVNRSIFTVRKKYLTIIWSIFLKHIK